MKKKFEILSGLPVYGEMYVTIPENAYTQFSEGLAVKLIRKDNSEWVVNFEKGNSNLKFACELKESENILIIAFGICYIMNAENTKPIIEFGFDYKEVFEYKNCFVLIGGYSISVVESANKIKHFDNLCYDGITNVELENGKINGILNTIDSSVNDIKIPFTLNLQTLEFTENGIIKRQNQTESRKWWKIWK
ncbi:hypothetical protein ACMDB5_14065 [Flavobacterium sp. W1B]|uniref:hypothetical protein n=1 Tax=Flavobacterium sp. W1B TaxID=3394146 RepID=UPI0039BCCA59